MNNWYPLPNLAQTASRAALPELSIRLDHSARQGHIHHSHRFQRERQIAVVRPLQLERRIHPGEHRPDHRRWRNSIHSRQPVGDLQRPDPFAHQSERGAVRLQLDVQQYHPAVGGQGEREHRAGHAGGAERSEFLRHTQHRPFPEPVQLRQPHQQPLPDQRQVFRVGR